MKQLLKDIAEIGAGQGAPQGDDNYCDYGIPFVKAGNLQELLEGRDIAEIQKVSDEVAKQHKLKLYPKGTILFAKSGMSCMKGYVYILPREAYVVSHLACVMPNDDISDYLKYYFKYHKPNRLVKDVAYPSISLVDIGNLEIDLKTFSEREEIVNQLKHTQDIISLRQQELQKLDELIKARFVEMFGNPDINEQKWEICKLEALCDVGSSKRIYQSEQSLTGIPFLRISDLVNRMDNGSLDCDLFIPETRYEELKEQGLVPQSGDILLTARGTLGRCYIVKEDDEFYFQDGMITWLSNYDSRVTPLYISYLFEMPGFRKQIDALQAGSTVAYLSIAMAKKLDVMVPTMDAQNQFADFVKQVDKSKVAVLKALDEAQLLFDSLMQEYFR